MPAPNSCDPCNTCLPGNFNGDAGRTWWMQAVLSILCEIAGNTSGEGTILDTGEATLVGGNAVVNSSAVGASNVIELLPQNLSGTPGILSPDNRVVGTSFEIQSSSGADTRTVRWKIYAV